MTVTDPRPALELRRAVLAFALREPTDLADIAISDGGVHLPGGTAVSWDELAAHCTDEAQLPRQVARWLRLRARVAALVASAGPDVLLAHVRPLALPADHALRPGPHWACREVLGGALQVGLALRGVDDDGRSRDDALGVLPLGVLRCAGIEVEPVATCASRYLEEMGELAAERLLRSPHAPMRPVGDCDVVTLLASTAYRHAVVRDAAGVVGLRCAAVPDRRRGWLDIGRVDPAFALAAASLTDPDRRGFSRPLLVTADEVVQVRDGGDPTRYAVSDPLGPDHVEPVQRLH